jgi:hypothetical protein
VLTAGALSVILGVLAQGLGVAEALVAFATFKGSLLVVAQNVALEVDATRELLAARVAREDVACVTLEVQVQGRLPFEALATDVADVGFFNGVHPVVVSEVRLCAERLLADTARVWTLVRMAPKN